MARVPTGLALCFISAAILQAQTPTSDTNVSCIRSLALPTSGAFAAHAGFSGTVRATVTIGKEGKLERLDLDGENPVLGAEVRVAMSMSEFAEQCENRTVEFVFAFTLKDPMTDHIVPPAVRFVPPNRFELTFHRLRPIRDMAPPKPPPSKGRQGN